jgi:Flp pilus assembly protein TadB
MVCGASGKCGRIREVIARQRRGAYRPLKLVGLLIERDDMKKRKYQYTAKQEQEILDAANDSITIALIVAGLLGGVIFLVLFSANPELMVIAIVVIAIATFIFLNYRAWIVVQHRKKVASQDDNIEQEI